MSHFSPATVPRGLVLLTILSLGVFRPFILPARSSILNHQPQNQDELQIFTGTVISMNNGKFFLKSEATGTIYGLDNQPLARNFADKKVSVTGTLDKTSTIHIKNIEEQKA